MKGTIRSIRSGKPLQAASDDIGASRSDSAERITELEAIVRHLASFDGRDVMMLEMLQVVALAKRAIQK